MNMIRKTVTNSTHVGMICCFAAFFCALRLLVPLVVSWDIFPFVFICVSSFWFSFFGQVFLHPILWSAGSINLVATFGVASEPSLFAVSLEHCLFVTTIESVRIQAISSPETLLPPTLSFDGIDGRYCVRNTPVKGVLCWRETLLM